MTQFTQYRCFYIDALKGFVGSDAFEAIADALAVERATTMFHERGIDYWGFEVWQGDRMVHRQKPIPRA